MGETASPIYVRKGTAKDMPAVHALVQELADYEKEPQAVSTTAETFVADGFGETPWFSCFVAEHPSDGIVGFALYFNKYSTWKGRALYLEDLYVQEKYRQHGIGTLLFKALVAEAKVRQCQRMEWQVLDWNAPAIRFYEKLGADLDATWINGKLFPADFDRLLAQ